MAKRKKETGYVFLPSFAKFIELLPEDQQLEMFWAITEYGLHGKKPDKGSTAAASLELIIPVIDASQNRYKAAVENGKKGGRPKTKPENNQKETRKKPEYPPENNQRVNQDIDIESDIESEVEADSEEEAEDDSESKKEKKKEAESEPDMLRNQTERPVDNGDNFSFSDSSDRSSSAYPLTVGEVRTYCQTMGLHTDPERFFEYHQKRNWVLGDGKPVRDWKLLAMSETWNVKEIALEQPKEQPKQDEIEKLAKKIIFSGNPLPPKDLEEVKEYCDGWNDFSPEEFYNYFEDKFWKLFDKPVINWKMAVKLWRREIMESQKSLTPEEVANNIYKGRGNFTIWDKEEAWTDFKNGGLNLDQQLKDAGKLSSFGCPCPLGMTMEMFEEYYRKMKD